MTATTAADNNADGVIATMVTTAAGLAIIPAQVNWAFFAAALGAGAVSIGACYGVRLTKDEGFKLVRQFIFGAGFTFLALTVGSKLLAALLSCTGIGHVGAVAMDATISGAIAYAVGASAKAYFQGERDEGQLRKIFRDSFIAWRNKPA